MWWGWGRMGLAVESLSSAGELVLRCTLKESRSRVDGRALSLREAPPWEYRRNMRPRALPLVAGGAGEELVLAMCLDVACRGGREGDWRCGEDEVELLAGEWRLTWE